MSVFAFDNVDAGYEDNVIFRGIDFEIEEGEIVSVLGRNGIGKTTILKTAIGILPVKQGTIRYYSDEITTTTPDERARLGIGYVPQEKEIFPRMTVHENILAGRLINESGEDNLLQEVYGYFPRLEERKDQKGGTLSGGEQQMLAIARALVGDPDLLLMDEPSEGIQPTIISDIEDVVREIARDLGMTIFFVEQNLEFAIHIAERCYVLENDEIAEEVTPEELRESDVIQKYIIS